MNLRFWKQPILVTAVGLLGLYFLGLYFQIEDDEINKEAIRALFLAVGFLIPHLLVYLIFQARPRINNMLITFLILMLLSDRETGILLMFSLGLVTALIKILVRINHQPVFNPAAAGLFLLAPFGLVTTWWGASFSPRLPLFLMSISSLIVLPLGLWIIYLYKKLPTLISVVAIFTLVYFLFKQTIPLRLMLEGTFAFYLFIMVTEPKTTPVVDWQEWINGMAIGGLLAFLFVSDVSNPYLVALLGMNLVFAIYKWIQLRVIN